MMRLRMPGFLVDCLQKSKKWSTGPASDLRQHDRERQQFKTVLESFRATRIADRLAVLDAFLAVEQHISLAELQETIRRKQPALQELGFLRETMEMFCQFGFARQRTFESRDPLYEHRHLGTHHDHFICIRCGTINEFADDELERLQMNIAGQHRFHPLQHRMEIYGLCADCMRQRDENMPLALAAPGEKVRIVRIDGEREDRARFAGMGLAEGVWLEVISNMPSGPSIVAAQDTRLALTAAMAQQIIVSAAGATEEAPDSLPG